jgi:hypothetical protein
MDRRWFLGGFVVAAATGCTGFKWFAGTEPKSLLGKPIPAPRARAAHRTVPLNRFITWTGAVDGDWSNPKNWRPQIVPRLTGATVVVDAQPGSAALLFPEGTELDALYVVRGEVGYRESGYAVIETVEDFRPMDQIARELVR